MTRILMIATLTFFSLTAMSADKGVFFVYPKDGDTVSMKFKAKFGLNGMKLRPAGEAPDEKTSGHLHIIIDGQPVAEGAVIPTDATHLHYGKAQIEGEIALAPGKHTLTLQLADGLHRAYGPEWTRTISVTSK